MQTGEDEEGGIWDPEEDASRQGGSGFGGSVSTMAHTKEESEKTLHGFAVENDVKGIQELLAMVPDLDLNELDEHVSRNFVIEIFVLMLKPFLKGYTPLHLAADRGHLDIVKLLLSKGVDKSIKVRPLSFPSVGCEIDFSIGS